MRYARSITLLSLLALLLTVPAVHARTTRPYVKSVTPLNVSVGEEMTVQGFYFRKGYAENTVVFVAPDGRVAYVKSEHSTKKTLTVIISKKVEKLLRVENGERAPTQFRIKVIARRMSRLAKRPLAKPIVGPDVGGDCDKDGTPNPSDADDDGDLLPDNVEDKIRTNSCVSDSDGDKLLDGWEYLSSLDLNNNALPFPEKRPYPNALFADAELDFDGDGLHAWAEHGLWWQGGRKYPLDYSDGDQTTQPDPTGAAVWNDWDRDGILSDDERDFDKDGLANVYEFRAFEFAPWEPQFPGVVRPDMFDPDIDGDGVLDGWDDQDHDDVSNIDELRAGTWAMNPCDPGISRTCPRWLDETLIPDKPTKLCMSTTIERVGFIKWFTDGDVEPSGTGDEAEAEGDGACPTYP